MHVVLSPSSWQLPVCSVSRGDDLFGSHCINGIVQSGLLSLAYFTRHDVSGVHPHCSKGRCSFMAEERSILQMDVVLILFIHDGRT